MTADGIMFLTWFFQSIWKFFISWYIPGTNTTPAMWFIFLIVAGLSLTIIPKFLGTSWFGK